MTSTPARTTERTTTVVIGLGFSGLAVASELSRQGVNSIVVDGLGSGTSHPPTARSDMARRGALGERSDILRLLVHYAQSHHLDIRSSTRALELTRQGADSSKWAVHTPDGILLADSIVLTRCAQSHLRRLLRSLGIALGHDLLTAMRAVGIYMVGIGDTIAPSTKEILRQAKVVGRAISAATAAA